MRIKQIINYFNYFLFFVLNLYVAPPVLVAQLEVRFFP